jgi:hypothetical protein
LTRLNRNASGGRVNRAACCFSRTRVLRRSRLFLSATEGQVRPAPPVSGRKVP